MGSASCRNAYTLSNVEMWLNHIKDSKLLVVGINQKMNWKA